MTAPLSESCATPFRDRPLPVETLVFTSDSLRIGAFRCPSDHRLFENSGPIDNDIFVFPRRAVRIQHENDRVFIADPLVVTLYNRGENYRRTAVERQPDLSDWFALAPAILEEIAKPSGNVVFNRRYVTSDRSVYLRQRRLFDHARAGLIDDLQAVEQAAGILETLLISESTPDSRTHEFPAAAAAREWISLYYAASDTLQSIASNVNASPYHLARNFRRAFGMSIGEYREELRLRASLGRLADGRFADLALDLGFSSHAHFTYRFRRAFGITPAVARRMLMTAHVPESTSKASAIIRGGAHRWRYSHTARISFS